VCFCGFVLLFFSVVVAAAVVVVVVIHDTHRTLVENGARSALGVDLPCRLCQLVAGSSNIFYFILFFHFSSLEKKENEQ
jgi:hypothetical protein